MWRLLRLSSVRTAPKPAVGLRCMWRCGEVLVLGQFLDGLRRSASREQKVWRRMWMLPVTFSPASRWMRLIFGLRSTNSALSFATSALVMASSRCSSNRGIR
ncbi:hypothetical protein D7X55_32715 [Corallococcus sp. AB049A]|nr:hypothetical protein D7X55_32715 [Corallococcus sp. AB049A]